MAEQLAASAATVSGTLTEPTAAVRKRWIGTLGLSSLVMWMAVQTPSNILLPAQVQAIDPKNYYLAFGVISAIAAVGSVIATPIAGALSDRTTGAYSVGHLRGRRHRWTLAMATLGAISLFLTGRQGTVLGVGVAWVLFNIFQNAEYASLSAAVPDHVPVSQRATVAGWFGMPQALGLVVGAVLVTFVFKSQAGGYAALAVALLLLTLPFVLFSPDHELLPEHRERLTMRDLLSAFWVNPKENPDFAWAWITRFLASMAIALGTLFLLYFLRNVIHYRKVFHASAFQGLLILIVIYTACVVLTAIFGGMLSDRLQKRKMMVTIAGLLMAVAAAVLTFYETWHGAMIAAVLYGCGFGAYLAVDQALITQVLPAATDRAKDLGIINIAIVGPYALAAPLGAVLIQHFGGYPTLFAATGVIAILGSILVWRIKSVA